MEFGAVVRNVSSEKEFLVQNCRPVIMTSVQGSLSKAHCPPVSFMLTMVVATLET